MKNKILIIVVAAVMLAFSKPVSAQISNIITGSWNFQCPYAPEGFNTGVISIKKDSVYTSFTGTAYSFPSTWVKCGTDSLKYNVDINGDQVLFSVRIEKKDTLNGKAGTDYGKSPLILTRKSEKKPD